MKNRLPIALLSACVITAGCSSISLPSLPWSGSAAKADPTAEALFEEGKRAFNDKKYVRAIDNFSKIKTDHPFSPQVAQAELMSADAYYLNQQYPEAINAFKEYQSLHPTSEQIPIVILRLGQAHFDQFTSVERDQKNTEIAKGYFETLIINHPKSPQAAIAKENLARVVEYLAEHEFSAAYFYFQQQKYPAARDRFEEIVRKYKDTPTAVKSLFFLGESYRNEKNGPRATLAFEALIQRYPKSPYASEARSQLALVEKEKLDPLDLLLMRDRRPGAAPAQEVKEDSALAKLKDLNLVAKNEVVHEEPGDEKGFFRRVADKINPFSSSGSGKKEDKPESAIEMLAKKNQPQKQESGGFFASLWPFGSKPAKEPVKGVDGKSGGLVAGVDESLKQKGIDAQARQAALAPPVADLPKTEESPVPQADTVALLSSIDANLKKRGTNANELPPPPPAAEAFKNAAVAQALVAKAAAAQQPSPDVETSGILSSIDQKLKARGVEPAKFEKPPTPEEIKATTKPQPKSVELEPKLALEKGPLFLNPGEVQAHQPAVAALEANDQISSNPSTETFRASPSRPLVKGPVPSQPAAVASRAAETKKPSPGQEDEPKGVFEQLRQDLESVSKALNPFNW